MIPHCLGPFQDDALYVPFVGREPMQHLADAKPLNVKKQPSKQSLSEMEVAEVGVTHAVP